MSISGGIKTFSRSQCLFQDDTTVTASTGQPSADRCIDRNPISYWRSVLSNDATVETLEIVFDADQTFNRIFLQDHNFKLFNIQYFSGAAYIPFVSVVGINGSLSGITETVFAQDTSYYEFTQVTTSKIRIQITSTQVANAQKYLSQVICCTELGTFVGYPEISGLELDRQNRNQKMLSGRLLTLKSDDVFQVDLNFKNYPSSLSADIDLIFSIHDLEDTILIWLCGGRFSTPYFRKQLRGYRLRDIIPVQMTRALKPVYSNNVFVNSVNFSARFEEAVD